MLASVLNMRLRLYSPNRKESNDYRREELYTKKVIILNDNIIMISVIYGIIYRIYEKPILGAN